MIIEWATPDTEAEFSVERQVLMDEVASGLAGCGAGHKQRHDAPEQALDPEPEAGCAQCGSEAAKLKQPVPNASRVARESARREIERDTSSSACWLSSRYDCRRK